VHARSQGSPNAVLSQLHAQAISDREAIVWLLTKACDERLLLQGRRTLKGDAEQARITSVHQDWVAVSASNLDQTTGTYVLLSFSTEGRTYSFSARVLDDLSKPVGRIALPSVVYLAERRDRQRRAAGISGSPSIVKLRSLKSNWAADGYVEDFSPVGLNVRLPDASAPHLGESIEVRFSEGDLEGARRWGQIRYVEPQPSRAGWKRIGLAVSEVPHTELINVETRTHISSRFGRLRTGLSVLSAGARSVTSRVLSHPRNKAPSVEIVDFYTARGERVRGVVDRSDSGRPSVAVVIPPAWGRTKETLLPLAMTIVEVFRAEGERVAVLRFDGTRRRGESFKESGCEKPGLEHLAFTFSNAVEDIVAAADFVRRDDGLGCERCVLVTFSAASIEGRRSILRSGSRINGWVSVVGTPDLQSGMRAVSGGVDYVGGAERGVRFGLQEIMGVMIDVDAVMEDALRERLPFLEDARREMQSLEIPVTWIHGAHDGWLDISRVREIMSCGDSRRRRLVEVPTGHQLRSSVEALEVFGLVGQEVARIALGRPVKSVMPSLLDIENKRLSERSRLPKVNPELSEFWRDYLVGRDGQLGIELMTATSAYAELMEVQIDGLNIRDGDRIADVGSGTGSFPLALLGRDRVPCGLEVVEIDYVRAAQARARERIQAAPNSNLLDVQFMTCDLADATSRRSVFGPSHYDSILVSLVLGYLTEPLDVLRDLRSSIRPQGRLVISVMRRDADISRLFVDAMNELRAGRAREILGEGAERILDVSARHFLNDAARILDLEEAGVFQFLDIAELRDLVVKAGFRPIDEVLSFGDPPQAAVLIAEPRT
jgi:SAM-dependent methyltransferase